ncbi:magnesium transporter [Anaerocolumna xylanovorans DSM 12503]|uniref:Magnesium transporter n=2 Tax=Anaerocolumna TaxID=1843210 RepID=A0A1M7Y9X2_9FIRM|nr:magnesium transporter [Anaerocolumna xylanovorans DSM 12503]
MFYQLKDRLCPITIKEYDPSILTLGIISLKELTECYTVFGFSQTTVMECQDITRKLHGIMGIYDDYHFGIITAIDTKYFIHLEDRIGIYTKENLFLIVIIKDQDNSIHMDLFESLDQINFTKISLERLIYGFLERLLLNNYTLLEEIEDSISEFEDSIDDNRLSKDFYHEITKVRKRLLLLDNYYEQLILIGEELRDNSIGIFEEGRLRYFKLFTDRVIRLSNNVKKLDDYSIHVRDAYHARMDYNLNNIMKLFTVITTIFLPLTLIVGWYGMNFNNMPELSWQFGYPFVIILSIVVVIVNILYFKRKKFL